MNPHLFVDNTSFAIFVLVFTLPTEEGYVFHIILENIKSYLNPHLFVDNTSFAIFVLVFTLPTEEGYVFHIILENIKSYLNPHLFVENTSFAIFVLVLLCRQKKDALLLYSSILTKLGLDHTHWIRMSKQDVLWNDTY